MTNLSQIEKGVVNAENTLITASAVAIFAVLSFVGIMYHELWLDEAHHWLIARDSKNLLELWTNTRYEGHPILWNFILFIITRLTNNPFWMQVANWLIAVSTVLVFMRYAPLSIYWKILFIFGYFTLYEYTVLSRNYSMLVLSFFLSIHCYTEKKYGSMGLALFFLANTHLFGLLLAGWFLISTVLDGKPWHNSSFRYGIIIFTAGAILSVLQIYPPQDSPFHPHSSALLSSVSIQKLLAIPVRGFLPIVDFTEYHVWNSNLLTGFSKTTAALISLFTGSMLIYSIAQKKKSLILFAGFSVSIAMIIIVLYPASIVQATRHFGICYIAFIGCLWLTCDDPVQKLPVKISPLLLNGFVTFILLTQCIAGLIMFSFDISRPFSEAKNVVAFLDKSGQSTEEILTFHAPIPSISCYAGKKTHSLPSGKLESYYDWRNAPPAKLDSVTIRSAIAFANTFGKNCVLVTHAEISETKGSIIFLKKFTNGIVRVENYYVYKVIPSGSGEGK